MKFGVLGQKNENFSLRAEYLGQEIRPRVLRAETVGQKNEI